ncbi:restriction endonuclease subunit S [Vibrio parahaemolyticus]|uniref:restriction endonuclease subunit S n=1 Tax=Vibrio parahaemolyticus TaxID=670 RepID=UPI00111EA316|nr:restriction endonuclease subunit S [Vibrio parahaemolyticus]EHR0246797.1 restriction endonuclease subunit S [Vibrio parahaemolyticus]EJG0704711.1 restriction endonuclease subunit S [Vibrio parahaemolyticus]MBE4497941.1 restriction endonuclease subunit S [Vibrio parahaemolyticus]TOK78637.1 restriction endonuclease subunit S [Vibrio parahaemolyticus]
MSQLSYMDKLLDGVEVEWKELGNSITFQRGKRLVKSQLKESGEYAVFQNSMTPLGYYHESNVSAKSAFVICAGAAGEIGFSDDSFWAADDVYYAEQSEFLNSKYLYHFLLTQKHKIASQVRRASIPRLSKSAIEKLIVPIPCPDNPEKSLAIQAEIVRILDAFTDMTAELTTELTTELNLRKKQYNYYRDKLLSFGDGEVEWKTLGEVTQLITKGTTPKEFVSDGVNFIKLESFDDNRIKPDKFMFITPEVHNKALKRSVLEENDILFAIAGATIGKCAIVDKSVLPANTNQALAIVRLTQQVKVKFAFYYMQTTAMTDYIAKFNKTSAQPNINLKQMSEFKIPVPSINEQIRIIQILDNFNTSTSSIKEGLLREIELRQKQYEYYRDLLLSFPKSNEGAA